MRFLPGSFFARDAVLVARELVGKLLVVDGVPRRITEVEAYKQDAASHARTRTARSAAMFDTYAHVYVYLVYGMYHCLNITADTAPGAVLIRGVEDVSGPGRLCKALGITLEDDGVPLGGRFRVADDGDRPKIEATERVGIKKDAHLRWRFVVGVG